MKKFYNSPITTVIPAEPMTLMAGSEKRGFSTDGKYDISKEGDHIHEDGVEYNVYQQTGDGFMDID